jgi:Beta-lactamase enzyme family
MDRSTWCRRVLALAIAPLALVASMVVSGPQPAGAEDNQCAGFDPFPDSYVEAMTWATGGAHLSVAVEDISSGCRFGFGSHDYFPTASTVKAEIMGAVFLHLQDLGETVMPRSIESAVYVMIHDSDNDAASQLYNWLGGSWALQSYGERLGLSNTQNGGRGWGVDATTPEDQLSLLRTLLDGGGALNDDWVAEARRFMGDIAADQAWGVSAGIPAGSKAYLKNGWLVAEPGTTFGPSGYLRENSMGLVQLPNGRRYTIAVFGNEWVSERFAISVIENISSRVASTLAAPRLFETARPNAATTAQSDPQPNTSHAGVFVAMTPKRLLDTRSGTKVQADGTIDIDVRDLDGEDRELTAVALNITVTDAEATGFVTAFADGTERPLASNLNQRPGRVTPNLAVVPVGENGRVRIYSSTAANVIVDILGRWYTAGETATAGRFEQIVPSRLYDSRQGRAVLANGAVSVTVRGVAGIPRTGVAAVAVNVTITNAIDDGYWTIWPAGTKRPEASNINTSRGDTIANTTLVPIGRDGSISIFGSGGGHVIVDVVGWFTDETMSAASTGRFVVQTPTRVADSRLGVGMDRLWALGPATLPISGVAGVPATATAVLGTLTYVDTSSNGYVTVRGDSAGRVATSAANPTAQLGAWANTTVSAVGSGGAIVLEASGSSEMIVDLAGYFTA